MSASAGQTQDVFKDLEDNLMLFLDNPESNEAEIASEDDAIATLVSLLDSLEAAGQGRRKVVRDILEKRRPDTAQEDLERLKRQEII